MLMDKRFIESSFPINEFNKESKETLKISNLHKWWARSSLACSRAICYAALTSEPMDEVDWIQKRNLIIQLSKSDDPDLIQKAINDISKMPKVLDPFAGGGSIPLEALRLGCETYSNEYNPVAVLMEKCTLEYPQKYGKGLSNDFSKWIGWVFEEVKKEVGMFYPDEPDGSRVTDYIWARTIPCQNPECGAEIPLMKQFWLVNKKNRKITLYPNVVDGEVSFEVLSGETIPNDFDPTKGSVDRAVARCPVCDSVVEAKLTRKLFEDGKAGQRMVAVVTKKLQDRSKSYRTPNSRDIKLFNESISQLDIKKHKTEISLPEELISQEKGICLQALSVRNYGFKKWKDLFNPRQQLVFLSFVNKINEAHKIMLSEGLDDDYAKAITSYMALNLGKLQHFYSGLARWNPRTENVRDLFGRPAISLRWECGEINPFLDGMKYSNNISKFINETSEVKGNCNISQSSATALPYKDNYFDAVITDPPYYNNIPYSFLSDFFYVWLKRNLGDLYPELFLSHLTPKKEEIIAHLNEGSYADANAYFERKLEESFKEIYRVLKENGVFVIGYTHKTTEGLENIINSLHETGFSIRSSWPLNSMLKNRLRSNNSAAISSSIYITARKITKTEVGFYKHVKNNIREHLPEKLDKLWAEGILGTDFLISSMGLGIEPFDMYEKVLDNSGKEIKFSTFLRFLRKFILDYISEKVFYNVKITEISPRTMFYVLWRWNWGESNVPFDEVRKLAHSTGLNLEKELNKEFILKKGSNLKLLGPDERSNIKTNDSVDILHRLCMLWKKGENNKIKDLLRKSDLNTENLYAIAKTISGTLPNQSIEKKLLEGFLSNIY